MRNFQNESLSAALTGSSAVSEIRVALKVDGSTPSGFQWSTSKGPAVALTSGTLCTAQVVTRRERPITLFLPYVKKVLGLG
jgi:HlyD family secretion protein